MVRAGGRRGAGKLGAEKRGNVGERQGRNRGQRVPEQRKGAGEGQGRDQGEME